MMRCIDDEVVPSKQQAYPPQEIPGQVNKRSRWQRNDRIDAAVLCKEFTCDGPFHEQINLGKGKCSLNFLEKRRNEEKIPQPMVWTCYEYAFDITPRDQTNRTTFGADVPGDTPDDSLPDVVNPFAEVHR